MATRHLQRPQPGTPVGTARHTIELREWESKEFRSVGPFACERDCDRDISSKMVRVARQWQTLPFDSNIVDIDHNREMITRPTPLIGCAHIHAPNMCQCRRVNPSMPTNATPTTIKHLPEVGILGYPVQCASNCSFHLRPSRLQFHLFDTPKARGQQRE